MQALMRQGSLDFFADFMSDCIFADLFTFKDFFSYEELYLICRNSELFSVLMLTNLS
jgi:hypothetical protein